MGSRGSIWYWRIWLGLVQGPFDDLNIAGHGTEECAKSHTSNILGIFDFLGGFEGFHVQMICNAGPIMRF